MTEDVQRTPANDNPFYRMMTLYGEQEGYPDEELHAKNRMAWNRWMAERLTDEQQAELREKGFSEEELTPFDDVERVEIRAAYLRRSACKKAIIPDLHKIINFCHVLFNLPLIVSDYIFVSSIQFSRSYFADRVHFQRTHFANVVYLDRVIFKGLTNFNRAYFAQHVFFIYTIFNNQTWFKRVQFKNNAIFEDTHFDVEADFGEANFECGAHFNKAYFSSVRFEYCKFKYGEYNNVVFSEYVDFSHSSFVQQVNFVGAYFEGYISRFEGATFDDSLNLEQVIFKYAPPRFFDTDLKQATFFHGVSWPKPPKDKEIATKHADAYQRLKLFMDEQKRQREELDFFILEMKCRRRSFNISEKIVSYLFEWASDFGRSLSRPVLGLLLTVFIFHWAYYFGLPDSGALTSNTAAPPTGAHVFDTPHADAAERIRIAASLSAANTFRVFGGTFVFADEIKSLSFGLRSIGLLQSFLGTVFLALFGLGLRNRFRLN